MAKEQRQWPRVACHLDITLKPGVGTTDLEGATSLGTLLGIPVVSKNFSLFGLCIKTRQGSIKKKDRLYLTIDTPIEAHLIELESEVIWNSGDEIGVRFINLQFSDQMRLKNCFQFFRNVSIL
jgi:hypothetical protein